jgi:hypothetical protein
MLNRFMISVAAIALVAGTGLANAQGTMKSDSGGAGAQPMQQSQPSGGAAERGGTMGKESAKPEKGTVGQAGGSGTMKSGTSAEEKSPGAMKDERSGREMNKNAVEDKSGATKGQRTDERAQGQQDRSKSMSSETDTKSGKMDAQTKGAQTKGADSKSQTTTGNAASTATAAPPPEKRTEITSAIKSTKIEETTNVNFNISVGATIPASVRFHPLPPRIVEIYPEWRGYDVIFVHGQYIIVRPQTREIVYIIEG